MNNFLVAASILIFLGSLLIAVPTTVLSLRLKANLASGKPLRDFDGNLISYYIYAEERAAVAPVPEIEILNLDRNKERVVLQPFFPGGQEGNPGHLQKFDAVKGKTVSRTRSRTESRTFDPDTSFERSVLQWSVRSAPGGLNLNLGGPRRWVSNARQRFVLTDWIFPAPGTWNIDFNVTFFNRVRRLPPDGHLDDLPAEGTTVPPTHFRWNWTVHVSRQPAFIVNGPTPFGYNGSKWSPSPVAIAHSVLGQAVPTDSVSVTLELQAWPVGATWTGTFTKFTGTDGIARFEDIVVSVPGKYTYRFVATLSDGTVKRATSVQIAVERALPVTLERLTNGDGISRFWFFETLKFRIFDQVGADYDPRLNLTLTLASNSPSFSYDGYDTKATLLGISSVQQNQTGYLFEFPGLSIDLPGTYAFLATIDLPDGNALFHRFTATIYEAPTFTFQSLPLRQNRVARLSVHGEFPFLDRWEQVHFMLSTKEDCTAQASDMVVWNNTALIDAGGEITTSTTTMPASTFALGDGTTTTAAPPPAPISVRNFTFVPWYRGTGTNGALHMCMRVPSQPMFGLMVQRYLQQFDEGFPFITQVDVIGFDECQALTNTEAFQYQQLGWDTAEGLRSYGCALSLPSSGTIAPCSCPVTLQCAEMRHPAFHPSDLNIGRCNCCAAWIMAIASLIIAAAFFLMMYVIYTYV